ncbi:Retrovirus-related Pol polyprotein from transposon RE2 [Vitis vinifera]|uniref:Retrovirus-related Pol polyprotein from transposon RE2 n=1 Tax=Vitis vinifera TaxID=29760 RepID=A0A438J797_VITVI|nr:Retrovirus-related Pol polyprotein from transposon RE2 [Vitis vinifera]
MSPSVPPSSSLPPSVDLLVPCVDTDLLASSHTHNIHHMVTRSKASIYKPKLLLSVSTNLLLSLLPFSKLLKILHGSRPWNWNLLPLSTTRPSILFFHFPQARQLDIHKVFLHGDLAKVIFMEQPLGFVDPLYPTHVCKLDKSLYDLKQSPRVWLGGSSHLIGIHLSQAKYITDLLTRAATLDVKPCPTPMCSNTNFSLHDGVTLENGSNYRSFVDALLYCTMIRPDIAFAINKVCQFMHHPSDVHWQAIKRILRLDSKKSKNWVAITMGDDLIPTIEPQGTRWCMLVFLSLLNFSTIASRGLTKFDFEELTLTMGLHAESQSRVKVDVLTSIEERFPSSRAKVPTVDATPPILLSDKPSSSSHGES